MTQVFFDGWDGVRLSYQALGPVGGRPILLLHGLAAGARQFAADADYFADLGYRVIVPDIRGHGASGKPDPVIPGNFTIARLAQDMLAILDREDIVRVDWVGNSLGGIIGLWLLGKAPERIRSFASFGTAYRLNLPRLVATSIPLAYRLLGADRVARFGGPQTTRNRAAQGLVSELLRAFNPQVGAAIAENVRRYDLTANASGFAGPILLLKGGLDRAVNLALPHTLAGMAHHEHFTRIDLPTAGHCANLDATAAWRSALQHFWMRT